jgi:hypothetical protein
MLMTIAGTARLSRDERSVRDETLIHRWAPREPVRARDFPREHREFAAANSRSAVNRNYGVSFLLFTRAESIARRSSSIGCAPISSLSPIMKLGVEAAPAV